MKVSSQSSSTPPGKRRVCSAQPDLVGRIAEASSPAQKPVDTVVLKPLSLNLMETWLAGELSTVLGKCEGLTERGPSIRPERSNCEML